MGGNKTGFSIDVLFIIWKSIYIQYYLYYQGGD